MVARTSFSGVDFTRLLAEYDLGAYVRSEPVSQGTVQTNYFLQTTAGRYLFRYYDNRPRESVLFEADLLAFLTASDYPCPAMLPNVRGGSVGEYRGKPFVIMEFVEGEHLENPGRPHFYQLVQKAAELQTLTRNFRSDYTSHRWNYCPDLCRTLASARADELGTRDAREKHVWLDQQLGELDLPPALPMGICHCDFHYSNVLFQDGEFAALLDFDDANHTYLQFDLVGLIEGWGWPHYAEMLDLTRARSVVAAYEKHRPLSSIEREHLFDVYRLSILFDSVWYFDRGPAGDFYERRKIDALTSLGRERFTDALFGPVGPAGEHAQQETIT